jgi:hypothetical protein
MIRPNLVQMTGENASRLKDDPHLRHCEPKLDLIFSGKPQRGIAAIPFPDLKSIGLRVWFWRHLKASALDPHFAIMSPLTQLGDVCI